MAQYSCHFTTVPNSAVTDLPPGWKGFVQKCQVKVKRMVKGVQVEGVCGALIRCKNSATSGLKVHIDTQHPELRPTVSTIQSSITDAFGDASAHQVSQEKRVAIAFANNAIASRVIDNEEVWCTPSSVSAPRRTLSRRNYG